MVKDKKKYLLNKGVTLIALVVTVVVLLILAGISISLLTGDNGTISQANKSKEETEISEEKAVINYAITSSIEKDKYAKIKENIFKKELDKYIGEGKYTLEYNEKKDEYKVTFNNSGREYLINGDGEFKNSTIEFEYTPSNWTNENVLVALINSEDKYIVQIKTEKTGETGESADWEEYTAPITLTRNQKIYVKLIDKNSNEVVEEGQTVGSVNKIDKLPPKDFTPNVTYTTNSIAIKVSTTDQETTDDYGCSGIYGYRFSIDGGNTWTEYSNESTYTYTGLTQNTTYDIRVEAKDNAGNVKQASKDISTGEVPKLTTANTNFNATPNGWTNQDVTVQANTTVSGYSLQTSKDATSWSNTNKQIFTQNGTMYTRLTDGNNYGSYASFSVTNIDKTAPTISTALSSSGVTTKGFTLSVGVTDTESGLSKIDWYYKLSSAISYTSQTSTYTAMNGSTAGETTAVTKSLSLTNLTSGTYDAYVEVYDVAGNVTQSEIVNNITLGTVETASGGSASPTTWTNQDVTATLPEKTDYTTEYQIGSTTGTWSSYGSTSKPIASSNTTIYYRYNDGTNAGNYGSLGITNIDKTEPTINTALSSSGITTKGFTLNIGVTDAQSGLSKIIWYYKKSSVSSYSSQTNTYTEMNGSTAGTTTTVTKTISISDLTSGTYNAYAVVYDVAGNSKQSSTINITLATIATASGGSASPTTWTNGNVTITLPTQSGYTTQYQIGSTTGTWSSYNSSSKPTASANGTVYYRYNDGTNAGNYGSFSITNIDKTVPTISTALYTSNVVLGGFTLNIGVTDAQSGLSKIVWYYKLSSASSYTSKTSTYTTMNGSTAGTKTAVTKNLTLSGLTSGTYSAYAVVYDVAGNSKQSATVSGIAVTNTVAVFDNGTVNTSLIGSWLTYGNFSSSGSSSRISSTATINSNNITLGYSHFTSSGTGGSASGYLNPTAAIVTENMIDFSKYSKVRVTMSYTASFSSPYYDDSCAGSCFNIVVSTNRTYSSKNGYRLIGSSSSLANTRLLNGFVGSTSGTYTLDVSSVNTSAYLGVGLGYFTDSEDSTDSANMVITKIELVP